MQIYIICLKLVITISAKSFFGKESFRQYYSTQNERKFKLFRFFRK